MLKLTKNGLIEIEYKKEPELVESVHYWNSLRSACEIEDGVTLGDIFKFVESSELLTRFIGAYSWCGAIDEFHHDAKLPGSPSAPDDDPLEHLEISRYGEINVWHASEGSDFSTSAHFSGIAKSGQNYSVSYTPVQNLVHLPVKLNKKFTIKRNFEETIFEGETYFTLLDILDTIYDDISFMGGPKDNVAFLEEMHATIADIDERTARGEVVGIPMEQMMAELEADCDSENKDKN